VIAALLGASSPASDAVFRASEDGGCWRASGELTFANAGPALAAAQALPLPSTGIVQCEGIKSVDSAAVALLLSLKRHGAERGRPLTFVEVPPALRALAQLYGVEDILGA
jgi:ABC-type transporter Mla MlaB component